MTTKAVSSARTPKAAAISCNVEKYFLRSTRFTRLTNTIGKALERLFKLSENNTTIRTEIAAGLPTFLTMAYIIFVNSQILSESGVPFSGALFATCISAAVGSLMMGLLANYPFALAPGMGFNAYFAYTVA